MTEHSNFLTTYESLKIAIFVNVIAFRKLKLNIL